MASSQSHLRQWAHNRKFLGTIPPEFPDWLVTVTFYVALQAVDALFAQEKIPVTEHKQRNEVLLRTNRYSYISKHYMPLYSLCRTVRYLANPHIWVPFEEIEENVLARYLYPIEESIARISHLPTQVGPVQLIKPPPS